MQAGGAQSGPGATTNFMVIWFRFSHFSLALSLLFHCLSAYLDSIFQIDGYIANKKNGNMLITSD